VAKRINDILEPMRERRNAYQAKPREVDEILLTGTKRAKSIAKETMREVREAMGIDYHLGK